MGLARGVAGNKVGGLALWRAMEGRHLVQCVMRRVAFASERLACAIAFHGFLESKVRAHALPLDAWRDDGGRVRFFAGVSLALVWVWCRCMHALCGSSVVVFADTDTGDGTSRGQSFDALVLIITDLRFTMSWRALVVVGSLFWPLCWG